MHSVEIVDEGFHCLIGAVVCLFERLAGGEILQFDEFRVVKGQRLNELKTSDDTIAGLKKQYKEADARLREACAELTAARKALAAQRTEDYKTGTYKRAGGVIDPLPEDAPFFVKDYYDYYKTKRGYHERSGNSTDGWNVTGCQSFMNQPLLAWAHEIENPVLLIHGEKAHSRYFSEYAFEKMTGVKVEGVSKTVGNKELLIIPGAVHTDLYDDKNGKIPYDKMEQFFKDNLK